jgi:hypothetical protein
MFRAALPVLFLLLALGGLFWFVRDVLSSLLTTFRMRKPLKELRAKTIGVEAAKQRARAYILERGYDVSGYEPWDVQLRFFENRNRKEDEPIGRFSYVMRMGTFRPAPILQIDAMDGTVQQWKTFLR